MGAKQYVLLQAQEQRKEMLLTLEDIESGKAEHCILDRYIESHLYWRFLDSFSLVCREMW